MREGVSFPFLPGGEGFADERFVFIAFFTVSFCLGRLCVNLNELFLKMANPCPPPPYLPAPPSPLPTRVIGKENIFPSGKTILLLRLSSHHNAPLPCQGRDDDGANIFVIAHFRFPPERKWSWSGA